MPAILKQFQEDFANLFVPTGGFNACKETLFKHRALVITGASGTGKTMIAQQLQLKLWEEKQCQPFRQVKPSKFSDILKCNTKTLRAVHIDDVFGSSNFLKEKKTVWLAEFDDMAADLRTENAYIIFTSRDNIWNAHQTNLKKYDVFSHVVNLSDENFTLTENNKRDIFDIHAKKANLALDYAEMMNPSQSTHNTEQANKCPIGYPQRVRLLCSKKSISNETRVRYLRSAMEFLCTTIASYREDDHLTYCVLVMLLINDGRLLVNKLRASKDLSDEIKWCMRVSKVEASKAELLLDTANSLTASLLLVEDDCFVYQHQSIMEAVTLDFGKNYPSDILDRSSVQFLVERVFTDGSAPKDNEYIVKLQPDMVHQLCTRLVNEISRCLTGKNKALDYKRNHVSDADHLRILSSYSVIQDAEFNHVFLRLLQHTKSFHLLFTSATSRSQHPTFMFLAAASGQDDFVQEVFSSYQQDVQQIPNITEHLNAVLYAACYSGSLGAVRSLLASGAQVDYNTAYDPKAVENSEWYCRSRTCSTMMHAAYSDNVDVMRLIGDHLQQLFVDVTEYLTKTDDRYNYSSLHWWATGGRGVAAISFCLEKRVDINMKNKRQITALHIAAMNKDQYIINALLNAGADINAQNSEGQTALHISVACCDESTIQFLLEAGTNLNMFSKNGTALHNCATMGNVSITRMLLEAGADVKLTNRDGETTLHACARKVYEAFVHERFESESMDVNISHRQQEILRLLLETQNDDELMNQYDIEALRSCARHGYESALQLFKTKDDDYITCIKEVTTWYMDLKYHQVSNAAVRMINIDGKPALHKSAERGNLSLIRAMLESGTDVNMRDGGMTALHIATEHGHVPIVIELVQKGADLNLQNLMRKTPLHLSVQNGYETIVNLLLAAGANMNMGDNCNQTPLHVCAEEGNEAMIQILLGAGANINQTDNSGQTALILSAKSGQDKIIRLLLAAGADVNIMHYFGTALHIASENGNVSIVQRLLEKGAFVKEMNNSLETALHIAARKGYVSIVRLLLDAGVDEPTGNVASVDMKNRNEETALLLSTCNDHVEIVKLLLACGADVNITKSVRHSFIKHDTVLHIAAEKGNVFIVQALIENGADVKRRNSDGETALHLCAQKIYQFLVQRSLSDASNVNNVAYNASTDLPASIYSTHEQILQMMLENVDGIVLKDKYALSSIRVCAQEGYEAAVEPFRDTGSAFNADNMENMRILAELYMDAKYSQVTGANVNKMTLAKNRFYEHEVLMPALHHCAVNGYIAIVRVLIDAGIDVNMESGIMESNTALILSAINNNESMVALLLESGADVRMMNKCTETALHMSAAYGHETVVQMLLTAGAEVNVTNNRMETALHKSALHMSAHEGYGEGHEAVVRLLLASGVNVDMLSDDGSTALHIFATGGCLSIVKLLIAAGAKLNVISRDGTTLHICAKKGHVDITQILLAAGADANIRNKDDNTEIHIAAETG